MQWPDQNNPIISAAAGVETAKGIDEGAHDYIKRLDDLAGPAHCHLIRLKGEMMRFLIHQLDLQNVRHKLVHGSYAQRIVPGQPLGLGNRQTHEGKIN